MTDEFMSTFPSQLQRCVGAVKAKAFSISMKTVKEDPRIELKLVLMKVPLLKIAGNKTEDIIPEKKEEIRSTEKIDDRTNEEDQTIEVGEILNLKDKQQKIEVKEENVPEVGAVAKTDEIGMVISKFGKIEIGILIIIKQKKRGETEIAIRIMFIVIKENTTKINHIREDLKRINIVEM